MEKYTTTSFKPERGFAPIVEESMKVGSLNYSSILTELIHAAGRHCERFASDLFIYWDNIIVSMNDPDTAGFCYLLGFYESGVDSNQEILKQYNSNSSYARQYYRALYSVEFHECDDEDCGYHCYRLTLTKLSRW